MTPHEEILIHYGVGHLDGGNSGRYPWGSGKHPFQSGGDFLARIDELSKEGMSKTEIAHYLEMSTKEMRAQETLAKHMRRQMMVERARALSEDGLGATAIAKEMGLPNESSARSLLDEKIEKRKNRSIEVANVLEQEIAKKGMVDVGSGAELYLGCSKQDLEQALLILEFEGKAKNFGIGVSQPTNPKQRTHYKILARPDLDQKYAYNHTDEISEVGEFHSTDGGATWMKREYPSSISSERVKIRYAEEGGIDKDGVIEIRPGVKDLSLGNSHYAQVRIMVDGTHYLKGMAMYSDEIPDGYDIVFNTNKKSDRPKMDVLKEIKKDPDNPFGAYIKADGQSYYDDPKGKYTDPVTGKKQSLSAINKLKEEGDWDNMSKNLSSQFLSKQPQKLVNQQLNLTYADAENDFDTIMSINNPTIRRKKLLDFAEQCDASAVSLKAVAFPRQTTAVILPLTKIKSTEIYAPGFTNGEKVALVRYPHGGTFEIPELTVNNKNTQGKNILGSVKDAVGISSEVAERLSGADFDGDQVVVIPLSSKVNVKSTPPLKGLFEPDGSYFEPKIKYAEPENVEKLRKSLESKGMNKKDVAKEVARQTGYKYLTDKNNEMGKVSNLISDMTLAGAPDDKIARAVRHSMTVIDAEKHHLNYKQSERDNNINALKKEYQKHLNDDGYGGASTLISRHKQDIDVLETKGSGWINTKANEGKVSKKTGKPLYDPTKPEGVRIYNTSGREYTKYEPKTFLNKPGTAKYDPSFPDYEHLVKDKNGNNRVSKIKGENVPATSKRKLILETPDVRNLVSTGEPVEYAYADYANKMKALANKARKEYTKTPTLKYEPSAKKAYENEVNSLNSKLNTAQKNAPRERRATVIADSVIKAKIASNPELEDNAKELGKIRNAAMNDARAKVGADGKGTKIKVTDREWEAIQAGAITDTKLSQILRYADADDLTERALPHNKAQLSSAKQAKIKAMLASGYTYDQIAQSLNVSRSTVYKYVDTKSTNTSAVASN